MRDRSASWVDATDPSAPGLSIFRTIFGNAVRSLIRLAFANVRFLDGNEDLAAVIHLPSLQSLEFTGCDYAGDVLQALSEAGHLQLTLFSDDNRGRPLYYDEDLTLDVTLRSLRGLQDLRLGRHFNLDDAETMQALIAAVQHHAATLNVLRFNERMHSLTKFCRNFDTRVDFPSSIRALLQETTSLQQLGIQSPIPATHSAFIPGFIDCFTSLHELRALQIRVWFDHSAFRFVSRNEHEVDEHHMRLISETEPDLLANRIVQHLYHGCPPLSALAIDAQHDFLPCHTIRQCFYYIKVSQIDNHGTINHAAVRYSAAKVYSYESSTDIFAAAERDYPNGA
ncbi:hypothetical protein LTR17_006117 [Elasticomyces elasticus]|nr:hypothetical protein LTR17_006117 [Elasticomyces elasticus]